MPRVFGQYSILFYCVLGCLVFDANSQNTKGRGRSKIITSSTNAYIISLPKAFLLETEHNIFIHVTSTTASLRIRTIDPYTSLYVEGADIFLNGSSSVITYTVPIVNLYKSVRLQFTLSLCSGLSQNYSVCSLESASRLAIHLETVVLPIAKENYIILGETDKPAYRADDVIKFRFLAVRPRRLKRATIPVNKFFFSGRPSRLYKVTPRLSKHYQDFTVYLEDCRKRRVHQWFRVSWQDAMNLSHKISKYPCFGVWKIVAIYRGQVEEVQIEVRRYLQPKFIVELKPPSQLLVTDETVKFGVCVRSLSGRPLRAHVNATLCLLPRYASKSKELPCLNVNATFRGCQLFQKTTALLKLQDSQIKSWNSRLIFSVNVTEKDTNHTISREHKGVKPERNSFRIICNGKNFYKPGLPYYSLIETKNHDNSMRPFTKLMISVEIIRRIGRGRKWGFTENVTSNAAGKVNLQIPPIPKAERVSITIKEVNFVQLTNDMARYPVILKHVLWFWSSKHRDSIQIHFPGKISINCAESTKPLPLEVQANFLLSNETVYIHIFSRGYIALTQISKPAHGNVDKCSNQDGALGHYVCNEDGGRVNITSITCLTGWTGGDCLEAVCSKPCVHGVCNKPNLCLCDRYWMGESCSVCQTRHGCRNGNCIRGNDCICRPGWKGILCHKRINLTEQFKSRNKSTTPLQKLKNTNADSKSHENGRKTIFSRDLLINLGDNYLPDARIIVFLVRNIEKDIVVLSDEMKLDFDDTVKCMVNQANKDFTATFTQREASPGSSIALRHTAGSFKEGLCGLRIIDTRWSILGESDIGPISILIEKLVELNKVIVQKRKSLDPYDKFRETNCRRKRKDQKRSENENKDGFQVAEYDSVTMFEESGIFPVTNTFLAQRRCMRKSDARDKLPAVSDAYDDEIRDSNVKPFSLMETIERKNEVDRKEVLKIERQIGKLKRTVLNVLPETWKFATFNVSDEVLRLKVPYTETSWISQVYCMTEMGLKFAPPALIKIRKPFSLRVFLTEILRRSEIVTIPVKLSNHFSDCYQVTTQITPASSFHIIGSGVIATCLCNSTVRTIYFKIQITASGKYNVRIESTSKISPFCSTKSKNTSAAMSAKYSSTKFLTITPEGIVQKVKKFNYFCLYNETISFVSTIVKPVLLTPNSRNVSGCYSANRMNSAIAQFYRLSKFSPLCGKLSIIKMIYAIHFLRCVNISLLTDEIKFVKIARKDVQEGIHCQLQYLNNDGSFRAFDKFEKESQILTTALYCDLLSQSEKYIQIGKSIITNAFTFLLLHQNKSGCFEEEGFDSWLLTIQIVAVLSDNSDPITQNISQNAMKCLKQKLNEKLNEIENNSFFLSLLSYVLQMHDPNGGYSLQLQNMLVNSSLIGRTFQYSLNEPENLSILSNSTLDEKALELESTSYALLALRSRQTVGDSLKLTGRLTLMLLSSTGVQSPSATLIGLKALLKTTEEMTSETETNLSIEFSYRDKSLVYSVNETHGLKEEWNIPEDISNVTWNISGTGCILTSLAAQHNVNSIQHRWDIPLKLRVRDSSKSKGGDNHIVTTCMSYYGSPDTSKTLLLTIEVISGWKLVRNKTLSGGNENLRNAYFESNRWTIFLDGIRGGLDSKNEFCIEFEFDREILVDNAVPGLITLADYFSPDVFTQKIYTLPQASTFSKQYKPAKSFSNFSNSTYSCLPYFERSENISQFVLEKMCTPQRTAIIRRVISLSSCSDNATVQILIWAQFEDDVVLFWNKTGTQILSSDLRLTKSLCNCRNSSGEDRTGGQFLVLDNINNESYYKSTASLETLQTDSEQSTSVVHLTDSLITVLSSLKNKCSQINKVNNLVQHVLSYLTDKRIS